MINFKDKTIILAVPHHFGLPEVFIKNLEFLGFKVFLVSQDFSKVKLSVKNTITHLSKKVFNNDKTYKASYCAKFNETSQLEFLDTLEKTDYALVIRPDLLSKTVLKKIKEKSNFSAAYQWDGMSRFPLAKSTIPFFDEFFVFDKKDTIHFPGTTHVDNFYFDDPSTDSELKNNVFFVGTFMHDRINELANLSLILKNLGLKLNINVIYNKERHVKNFQNSPIHFTKTGMSFEENMKNAKSSSIILDFQNSFHKGLSLRTFEAIGFGKKLITNNPLVKSYDFYRPENIFVIDHNLDLIPAFVKQDYVDLPVEIVEKYSFSNWIQFVLEKAPLN